MLALVLGMVNVLGLSKSNANPKGESTKGTIVNGEKDKIETTKRETQNVSWLDVFFAKRTLGEVIGMLLLCGYIYKQNRDINSLNVKIEKVKIKEENKEVIKPIVPENKENRNYLDPQVKKFLGSLAEKADKEFKEYVNNEKIVDDDGNGVFYGIKGVTGDHSINGNITFDEYRKFGGKSNRFNNDWQYFCRKEKTENDDENENYRTGWKIHISPDVLNCTEVFKLVYGYWCDKKFSFKFIRTPQIYRGYNCNMIKGNKAYQVGKYITIYPKDDKEAKEIVESLHAAFEKKGLDDSCFLEISDDFKVYPGIYVRMSEFSGKLDDGNARGKLCIPAQVFGKHCENMKIVAENYEHPFDKLYGYNIYELPKEVCKINDYLKELEKRLVTK